MNDSHYYMSQYDESSNKWGASVDLENKFQGLKVLECKGLSKYGKIKNIYTETYAETDALRIAIPEKAVRENTDVEFVVAFIGNNRRNVYDQFVEFLTGRKIRYWDNIRNKEADLILLEAISPSDDILMGSTPFIRATIKMKNINGQTKNHQN